MTILAIDPGPIESGWVVLKDGEIHSFGKDKNDYMIGYAKRESIAPNATIEAMSFNVSNKGEGYVDVLRIQPMVGLHVSDLNRGVGAIERVMSFGMPAGSELFETCFWSGRFYDRISQSGCEQILRPTRKEIVVHICGTAKAKDANVRQAMIDRWGAPGTKKNPGPTFGMAGDVWQALAVATYALDKIEGRVS